MKVLNFLLIFLLLFALHLSPPADAAISVGDVGPSSGELTTLIAGNTHYGQAHISQPYRVVFWYVKSPGQSGWGTLVHSDYGNGTDTTSYFQWTFNNGSATGDAYTITAEVFPIAGQEDVNVPIDSDSDSYTVTVYDEFTVPISAVQYYGDTNQLVISYNTANVNPAFAAYSAGLRTFTVISAQVLPIQDPVTGAPPPESGFRPKKGNPRTPDGGWIDRDGNKWKKDPSEHGGPHWDVTFPNGGYTNVYPPIPESPEWKAHGGRTPNREAKKRKKKIEDQMNQSSGSWFSPSRLLSIAGGLGAGYLIYKGGKTLIGIALLPTPAFAAGGLLIVTP